MGHCKIAIGICIAILLIMVYYVAKADARDSENLTSDQVAGYIPAKLMPDINPYAGLQVRDKYLSRRGWNRQESMCSGPDPWDDPWDKRQSWSNNAVYNANNPVKGCESKLNEHPIKGGDMKNAPSEVSTVNNNVKGANGKDNKESFSNGELMLSLSGRNAMWGSSESPVFWEPNQFLTESGFYHNASQGIQNTGTPSVIQTQENFTSEQLLMSAIGRNASNY